MCNCIKKVNEQLLDHNTRIVTPITFSATKLDVSTQALISTEKIDKKKKSGPVKLFASYCPICGKMYENG
jgi:hypothetical protein